MSPGQMTKVLCVFFSLVPGLCFLYLFSAIKSCFCLIAHQIIHCVNFIGILCVLRSLIVRLHIISDSIGSRFKRNKTKDSICDKSLAFISMCVYISLIISKEINWCTLWDACFRRAHTQTHTVCYALRLFHIISSNWHRWFVVQICWCIWRTYVSYYNQITYRHIIPQQQQQRGLFFWCHLFCSILNRRIHMFTLIYQFKSIQSLDVREGESGEGEASDAVLRSSDHFKQ